MACNPAATCAQVHYLINTPNLLPNPLGDWIPCETNTMSRQVRRSLTNAAVCFTLSAPHSPLEGDGMRMWGAGGVRWPAFL